MTFKSFSSVSEVPVGVWFILDESVLDHSFETNGNQPANDFSENASSM